MTRSFAIIPAAGSSRRMGRQKLLLRWGGSTVIESVLRTWRASRVTHVVVVTFAGDERLTEACRGLGAEVAALEERPAEMRISVQLGLARAERRWRPAPEDAWLLAPADMPRLRSETINRLLDAHDAADPAILAPEHGGRRGHPVLFPWPLADELARLDAGRGARALLEGREVRLIPCGDPGVLEDLDTPGDYDRLVRG